MLAARSTHRRKTRPARRAAPSHLALGTRDTRESSSAANADTVDQVGVANSRPSDAFEPKRLDRWLRARVFLHLAEHVRGRHLRAVVRIAARGESCAHPNATSGSPASASVPSRQSSQNNGGSPTIRVIVATMPPDQRHTYRRALDALEICCEPCDEVTDLRAPVERHAEPLQLVEDALAQIAQNRRFESRREDGFCVSCVCSVWLLLFFRGLGVGTVPFISQSISSYQMNSSCELCCVRVPFKPTQEREHAQNLMNYQNTRGGQVQLQTVPAPEFEWRSAKNAVGRSHNGDTCCFFRATT